MGLHENFPLQTIRFSDADNKCYLCLVQDNFFKSLKIEKEYQTLIYVLINEIAVVGLMLNVGL